MSRGRGLVSCPPSASPGVDNSAYFRYIPWAIEAPAIGPSDGSVRLCGFISVLSGTAREVPWLGVGSQTEETVLAEETDPEHSVSDE